MSGLSCEQILILFLVIGEDIFIKKGQYDTFDIKKNMNSHWINVQTKLKNLDTFINE